jgi:superfamily II DNA or RNA helicase
MRADRLAELLKSDGFHSAALHKLYSPTQREKIIQDFKEGIIQVIKNVNLVPMVTKGVGSYGCVVAGSGYS